MAFVPIVVGIKPSQDYSPCTTIDIIYHNREKTKMMMLSYIEEDEAKREIERHGIRWYAHRYRYVDGNSDWEYLK